MAGRSKSSYSSRRRAVDTASGDSYCGGFIQSARTQRESSVTSPRLALGTGMDRCLGAGILEQTRLYGPSLTMDPSEGLGQALNYKWYHSSSGANMKITAMQSSPCVVILPGSGRYAA